VIPTAATILDSSVPLYRSDLVSAPNAPKRSGQDVWIAAANF
jgi:hypothetical protein